MSLRGGPQGPSIRWTLPTAAARRHTPPSISGALSAMFRSTAQDPITANSPAFRCALQARYIPAANTSSRATSTRRHRTAKLATPTTTNPAAAYRSHVHCESGIASGLFISPMLALTT